LVTIGSWSSAVRAADDPEWRLPDAPIVLAQLANPADAQRDAGREAAEARERELTEPALAHAAVVFAAITVYMFCGRMPEVSVSTGTGAGAAQGLVVTSDPSPAEPVELPGVNVTAEVPDVPPTAPTPLQPSADAESVSRSTESWPGPAPDTAADMPGRVARLGFPASSSFATPAVSGRRLPVPPRGATASTGVIGQGDGIATGPPTPASGNRPPRYPPALRRRIEGTVLLKVEVRPTGDTGAVDVARSSGHRNLDDAAVEAVRKWRFRPATDAAGAVVQTSSVVTLPVEFVIRAARS
jgi:TonB family protein